MFVCEGVWGGVGAKVGGVGGGGGVKMRLKNYNIKSIRFNMLG